MMTFLLACGLIFILSLGLIFMIRNNAVSLGLIDSPNERSTHKKDIARGAGIGFFLSVVIIFPFFYLELLETNFLTFLAILMIFIIGTLDDHRDASPNMKFFVIIFATTLLYFDNIVIRDLGTFFGFELSLGWFALPFTIFAVVGFTNALNLIDGLDGLAAGMSIIIFSAFLVVGVMHDDLMMVALSSTFIATLLAFLVFNWHPASIFMGDSGSLTLGFVISLLAIKSLAYLPTVSILFIAAIPILDTVVVMSRRKLNGRSMFSADSCHIHHVLKKFFAEDTAKVVLFLLIFQSIYTLTGFQFRQHEDEGSLLLIFIFNIILLYMFLAAMIKRQKRKC